MSFHDEIDGTAFATATSHSEVAAGTWRPARIVGGKYELGARIGWGAMADVYLARDLVHDRRVAIKVFAGDHCNGIGAERFLREIATTARLHHPHLLTVYDSGADGGGLYYVMPWLEEGSLRQRLEREGRLPIREALGLVRNVVDGLAHAHEAGVVHRDIKPENVLLSLGHALVADFGVAKLMTSAVPSLSVAGAPLGTPAYMAPEQVAGSRAVDHRADLYAVGALLHELLTGAQVFPRATPMDVMRAHLEDEPPEMTEYRCDVPRRVKRLVAKCLNKHPAHRWQNARALLTEIDGVLSNKVRTLQLRCRVRRAAKVASAAVVAAIAVS